MASVTQAEVCNLISWACRVAERGEFYISKIKSIVLDAFYSSMLVLTGHNVQPHGTN